MDQLELQRWEEGFRVNATGCFLVVKRIIRELRNQQRGNAPVFVVPKAVLFFLSELSATTTDRMLTVDGGLGGAFPG